MEWTDVAAVVTAVSVLVTAVVGFFALFNTRKRDLAEMNNTFTSRLLESERQCREDHRICTDHLTAAHQRLTKLEAESRFMEIQQQLLERLHPKESAHGGTPPAGPAAA